MRYYVETPPATEPIGTDEAQKYLRMDADIWTVESSLVNQLIASAREYCERYCDRAFASQTWRVVMDELRETQLPGGVVTGIQSFTYTDGGEQTVDSTLYTLSRDGRLRLKPGKAWPDHPTGPDYVNITYDVGVDSVPQDVVQAMRMLMAHYYEERRSVTVDASAEAVPMGVEALLARHRVMTL